MPSPRVVLGRVAASAGLAVLCAASIECGARLATCAIGERRLSLAPRERTSLFVRDRELLYRMRPGFEGPWGRLHPPYVRVNRLGLRGAERSLERTPGVARVLVIGDSRAWGFDVEEAEAYPQALERALRAKGGEPHVEVVNAAVPGYTSYQGMVWLRLNIGRYRPDVVVASFGFNDRLLAGEKTGDFSLVRHTPESFRAAWSWRWLESSFAVRKLRALLARVTAPDAARQRDRFRRREAVLLSQWERLEAEVTPAECQRHLHGIAATCQANGAELVLVALPDNPRVAGAVDSAQARLRAGDGQGAWRAAASYFLPSDSTRVWSYTSFDLLANAVMQRARPEAPAQWPHLRAPANLVLSTASEYSRIAERVAEHDGAVFLDATAALTSRPEVFLDECHFDGRGHERVAELLAPAVLTALGGD